MKELEQPLISIIVPVYKVEKYLKRCVDSILTQTYQNMEIILVDDGSPDNCGAICDRYKETDNRVVVIHKRNGGLSDARNVAIPLAKGEYISFIDSDDWISSYYVEHLYEAVAKCDADIGISWFENVFEGKALQSKPEELLSNYECLTAEECLKKLLYQNGVEVCAWGKLYKTPLIKNLRYPVGKLYEDIPVTYEAVKQSKKIAVIGNVDYYYFQRTDSIQNIAFNVRKMDGIEHCYNMMKAVEADFPELKNAAECRYFSTVCNILFQIKDDKHESIRQPLSGYCFNASNSETMQDVLSFVKRKFKGLWFPYVLWMVVFSLLHNVFIKTGIYFPDPWSISEIEKNIIKSFFLHGHTQLGSALWFISTLMQIAVLYCCID